MKLPFQISQTQVWDSLFSGPGVLVIGTDTEIGKTTVACGLLREAHRRGLLAAGYKPVAAGLASGSEVNEDVARLLDASSPSLGLKACEVGPVQLRLPASPEVAAQHEGCRLELEPLVKGAVELSERSDWLLVEGVGGFRVPLAPGLDTAQMAVEISTRLALPVVLVVGLRLGCQNHALLTAESIQARGLHLLGWIANQSTPSPYDPDSLQCLSRHLPMPLLATLTYQGQV